MKDPAFLFYSKDFYEGTRMMLPVERACYVDLLIYQHQNGPIPNTLERVLLYCNGVDEATLKATLKSKFDLTEAGWVNKRLEMEMLCRDNYKSSQSLNGRIGQFWKKSRKLLSKSDFKKLQESIDKDVLTSLIDDLDLKDEGTLKGSLKRCLSIYANANENKDIESKDKGGVGEKEKGEKEKSFDRFNEWVDKSIPYLRRIKNQITFEEYCRLSEKYNGDQIKKILTDLSNYKDASKKYVSVNLTFQNWAKKEYG